MHAATATSANSHQPPSQRRPSTSGRPTTATRIREAKLLIRSAAESTPAARVLLDRGAQLVRPEVGPERVGEDVFGVRGLPEEEVRDAPLARRADHEVGVRHLGLVEAAASAASSMSSGSTPVSSEPPRRVDELGAAAVVERDPEPEPRVRRRRLLEAVHLLPEPVGRAVAPAEEPARTPCFARSGSSRSIVSPKISISAPTSSASAAPVLGRERVDGERLDAEVDRRLDDRPQRARAGAMPLGDRDAVSRAQRPFPSMMIATACATSGSCSSGQTSAVPGTEVLRPPSPRLPCA